MAALKFPLPTMPFLRQLEQGLSIGWKTSIIGEPYEDATRNATVRLFIDNENEALKITIPLGHPANIKIDAKINGKSTSAIERPTNLPYRRSFVLNILVQPHSFLITLDNNLVAEFVHRINPSDIRKFAIVGPLICKEVIIDSQPSAPPSYSQATLPATAPAIAEKSRPSAPSEDFPPPPPSIVQPSAPSSSSFNFTGGTQGFSNHPFPLPGLVDQTTRASQPLSANPLPASSYPQQSIPQAPASSSTASPPYANFNPGSLPSAPAQPSTIFPPSPASSVPLTSSSYSVPSASPATVYTPPYPQSPAPPVQQLPSVYPSTVQPMHNQMSAYPQPVHPQPGYSPYQQQMAPQAQFAPPPVMPQYYPAQPGYQYPAVYPQGYAYYQPSGYQYDCYPHHHHRHHHHCD